MHPIDELRNKEKRLVIGLMSGTSGDGIDAALVEISGYGTSTKVRRVGFSVMDFTPEVKQKILSVAEGSPVSAAEFCRLKTLIGRLHGEACLKVCRECGVEPEDIDLVGFHGQTVWHIPTAEDYCGDHFASTLQIGEEAEIVEMVGCPVVGDFRVRDVACGGQGAPLVPYTEYILYRSEEKCVALQNIGGIGNVTVRNIRAAAQCGIVRLLNQGGTVLHDITVDGVYDTSQDDDRLGRGDRGVKIGDRHLYGEYYSTAEETYNITVKNVEARAKVALSVCGEIKNLLIENINGFDSCETVIEKLAQSSD